MYVEICVALLFTLFNSVYCLSVESNTKSNLLLVSFDGFRWNYLTRTNTPNFDVFLKKGVHSIHGLKNAFITKTFPNHNTLVTGLWEESHGIVANKMWDPNLNETFDLSNGKDQVSSKWFDNGGEPIWVTNHFQSSSHRSGVMMWPGGCAPVKYITADHCKLFDPEMKNESRVDELLKLFVTDDPINLGLLYFEQPDEFGHRFGPESEQITRMIGGLDQVVGYLLKKLEELKLLDNMNIIITSDHGFASSPSNKVINLDDYIDPMSYRIFASNPIGNILPNEGKLDELYSNLTKASVENGHFKVYKKEDIPDRYHYKNNDRIMPILIVAEDHYQLSHNGSRVVAGEHGWDNNNLDMHPFFLAMGPSFKQGASVDLLDNVDIYPLMCHLLGLEPAPNNGTLQSSLPLLKAPHDSTMVPLLKSVPIEKQESSAGTKQEPSDMIRYGIYIGIFAVIAVIGGIFIIVAYRNQKRIKRNQLRSIANRILQSDSPPSPSLHSSRVHLLSDTDDDLLE